MLPNIQEVDEESVEGDVIDLTKNIDNEDMSGEDDDDEVEDDDEDYEPS